MPTAAEDGWLASSAVLRQRCPLETAERARDELPQEDVAFGAGLSVRREQGVEADEEERGAVVAVDIVIELAAMSRALDLGREEHERRVLSPLFFVEAASGEK